MSRIKKRMLEVIENMGITKYQAYKETGITRGVLDSDTGITEDNIIKFVTTYPVDLNWLILGEGSKPILNAKKKEVKRKGIIENKDLKYEIIRLLSDDEDIQDAFKYIIGKEINMFMSQKLLKLVNDKSFFDTISAYFNKANEKK